MKKIKRRAYCALLLALAVIFGTVTFVIRYVDNAQNWASFSGNESIYTDGVVTNGIITDRNGIVLMKSQDGVRTYADYSAIRSSNLHLIGDFEGNIGTGALTMFTDRFMDYSLVNGIDTQEVDLTLSADADLNRVACEAMGWRHGAVMVMDYTTGEIICMVSTPTYDPLYGFDKSDPTFDGVYLNRCISSTFIPGSVFKLVTVAAAIETIPDIYSRSFWCDGSVKYGPDVVTCTGSHGYQTIEEALAHSCNCAFAQIATELGGETLLEYAEKFGFTSTHELGGITTAAGRFEAAPANTSFLAWSGIGQYTDMVCPFSMLRYVSAIANHGELHTPTLLLGEDEGTEQLLSPETARRVGDMMSYNVKYGYGEWNFPGLNICAKSGTAERGDGTSNAWFTGFLDDPAHPYAFVVVIEAGGGGLVNAGAVANTVLQSAVNK